MKGLPAGCKVKTVPGVDLGGKGAVGMMEASGTAVADIGGFLFVHGVPQSLTLLHGFLL